MKISSFMLVAFLAFASVAISATAYADGGCSGGNCKTNDPAPLPNETARPAAFYSQVAPEQTVIADTCSGGNCKDDDDRMPVPDRRAPPPVQDCSGC
jgi:hypothetical protein